MDDLKILLDRIKDLETRLERIENRDHGNPLATLDVSGAVTIGGSLEVTSNDVFIEGDAAGTIRRHHIGLFPLGTYVQPFDANPSWSFAGSPFTTLYAESYNLSHITGVMSATSSSPGPRSFMYQSSHMPTGSIIGSFALNAGGANTGVGIRMDSGSDTNFVEVLLTYTGTAMQYKIRRRYQTGGGGINAADGAYNLVIPNVILYAYISGTRWTNWSFEPILQFPGQIYGASRCSLGVTGLTWTPTRVGIVWNKADSDASTWYTGYCDWIYYP